MNDAELHTLLVNARAIQAEHGHAKGRLVDEKGRVCMQGAIRGALHGYDNIAAVYWPVAQPVILAQRQAAQVMRFGMADDDWTAVSAMCQWNNQRHITLEDVLARFDAGIARLEARELVHA